MGNCRCCRRESAAPLSLSAAAEGPRTAAGATDRPRPTRAAEAVESARRASDAIEEVAANVVWSGRR